MSRGRCGAKGSGSGTGFRPVIFGFCGWKPQPLGRRGGAARPEVGPYLAGMSVMVSPGFVEMS